MQRMHLTAGAAILLAGLNGPASAQQLVATRPGIMCVSTDALGRLTLPNGDSRTHNPNPRPDDLAAAAAGGCIDIPPGARVQVQQAFRNTSRIVYAGPGAPADGVMTIPNIDFQPASDTAPPAATAQIPAGLTVAQHLPAGGGMTLVLLQDARLTPALREAMQPFGGDPDSSFADHGRLYAEFTKRPVRNGQLHLLTGDGTMIDRTMLEKPFATIKPAPLHGMAVPTFLLMVDYSVGMGGFNGPFSVLLAPLTQGLKPLRATSARGGPSEPIGLASTLHSSWQIAPSRAGGDEILWAHCPGPTDGTATLELRTYRFRDERWTFAARTAGPCGDLEVFPDRRVFP